jgi:gliding motility-associated-like protein
MLQQLDAPVVAVDSTTNSTITFKWDAVAGAQGYQVSIDGGKTFINPSTGSAGLSHKVTGLQLSQQVTILVQALGASACQLSGSSTAVTGTAVSQLGNQIYVANAFTPNGDGNNDIVYVHSESIKSLSFYVYDQWGELLFATTDIKKGWDGYYKGTKEPTGVYVYFVKAIMNDGAQLNKKGTITLLR